MRKRSQAEFMHDSNQQRSRQEAHTRTRFSQHILQTYFTPFPNPFRFLPVFFIHHTQPSHQNKRLPRLKEALFCFGRASLDTSANTAACKHARVRTPQGTQGHGVKSHVE